MSSALQPDMDYLDRRVKEYKNDSTLLELRKQLEYILIRATPIIDMSTGEVSIDGHSKKIVDFMTNQIEGYIKFNYSDIFNYNQK